MDISRYASEWLNAEAISKEITNPTKAKILDEGTPVEDKFGKKIVFNIEIEGTEYKYKPNKTGLRQIIKKYGADTMTWLGKEIELVAVSTQIRGELRQVVVVL